MKNAATLVLLITLLVPARLSQAQSFEGEIDANFGGSSVSLDFEPASISRSSMTYLRVSQDSCLLVEPNAVRIDNVNRTVDVSLSFDEIGFLCPVTGTYVIPIGVLAGDGGFNVAVYQEDSRPGLVPFGQQNLLWEFDVDVSSDSSRTESETPAEGSVQSGVGLIRGWACDAKTVEVQFDEYPRMLIPYGSSRADTNDVCGDNSNGYGAVFAWGLLGHGTHTMKTFIDGRERSEVSFEVNGLDEPFVKGLSGEYGLPDFPQMGQSVLIRWSEADQNFIIVERD
jgi:hypothetical protein